MNEEWSLLELLGKIKDWSKVEFHEDWRLRALQNNSLFLKEEMNKKLKELDSGDGGIRLRLESGEIPSLGEVALKIKRFNTDIVANIIVKPQTTIEEMY